MSETHIRKHEHYWQNKIAAWLNESPIKVFDIANRDKIAEDILASFSGLNFSTDKELVKLADHIASGLTRAILPSDFTKLKEIQLKHPLVKGKSLSFSIEGLDVQNLKDEIKLLLETDLSYLTKETAPEEKAKQIFNYLFFAFSKRLRSLKEGEIAKVGALWDILPADTRMPDHPMWHHFGLTSAIYSSLEANKNEKLCMVVYSITPVQDFISKARKLRDYWTGSVLLSYLAFTGITKVCEELGPDHILYPSLQNQALMEQWLSNKDDEMKKALQEIKDSVLSKLQEDSKGIASFPNKFVFICNSSQTEEICAEIGKAIDGEWKGTSDIVKEYIANKTSSKNSSDFNRIWNNARDKYWKYSWAATNFATIENEKELKELLPETKWKEEFETMCKFNESAKENGELVTNYDVSNLYGTTHSLAQGLLAAGKNKPMFETVHHSQNGEKCPLCGENEVLNTFSAKNGYTAKEYSDNIKLFWDKLRGKENSDEDNFTQVGKSERLCAVCALKRFLPVALKDKNHPLYETLVHSYKKDGFQSTTEMASYEYLQTVSDERKKEIVQKLHEYEFETDDEYLKKELEKSKGFETKYYAFLLMDGDKMGDLINGETTEAAWNDVLNIKTKENTPFADKDFAEKRRTINPALHAMISDSLNNFARYGVQPLVNASGGRLIYAGGDDVCAILPLSKAFETADKIRQVYQLSYAQVTKDGSLALLKDEQYGGDDDTAPLPDMDKIVMHLGHSENQDKTRISLSGAIIIAHHKQPLKEVFQDAKYMLEHVAKGKDKSDRNSIAIRLKKRSGGDRDMWFKWEAKNIFADDERTCRESFENVIKAARAKELSASLLYKIEELRGSIEPLAEDIEKNKVLILKLFEYELSHSGFKNNAKELAVDIAGLCVKKDKSGESKDWYNPEAAIIANFMAQKNKMGGKNND